MISTCLERNPSSLKNHSLALLCLPQKRGQVPRGGALSLVAQKGPQSPPSRLVSLQALAGRRTMASNDRLGSPAPECWAIWTTTASRSWARGKHVTPRCCWDRRGANKGQ